MQIGCNEGSPDFSGPVSLSIEAKVPKKLDVVRLKVVPGFCEFLHSMSLCGLLHSSHSAFGSSEGRGGIGS